MDNTNDSLGITAVALACGVHPTSVRYWVRTGKLRARKTKGVMRFDPAKVLALRTARSCRRGPKLGRPSTADALKKTAAPAV